MGDLRSQMRISFPENSKRDCKRVDVFPVRMWLTIHSMRQLIRESVWLTITIIVVFIMNTSKKKTYPPK